MSDERKFEVVLALKDADKVREELRGLGKDGQEALRSLERHAEPASKAMTVLHVGISQLKGGMKDLAGQAGGIGTAMAGMGGAGLAAGAMAGAVDLAIGYAIDKVVEAVSSVVTKTREAIETFDKIDESAEKIGVTTDAFQELQYAAMLSGVGAEGMEKALEQLNRRAGETAAGVGEAKDTFKRLGVSVTDSAGNIKSADTLLMELAKKFSDIQSPAERAAAAGKLFGEELGTKMAAMLAKGTAEMEKLRQEARDLGVVVDAHVLKTAADTADKLDTMAKVIDINLKSALVDLAPILVEMARGFAEAARFINHVVDGFRDLENRSTSGLRTRLETLRQAKAAAEQDRKALTEKAPEWKPDLVANPIRDLGEPKESGAPSLRDTMLGEHDANIQRIDGEIRQIEGILSARSDASHAPAPARPVLPPAGKDKKPEPLPVEETDKLAEYIRQMREKVDLLGEEEDVRARVEALRKASDIAISQNTLVTPEDRDTILALTDAMTAYDEAVQGAKESQRDLQQIGRQTGSALTKGLTDAIFAAKDLQSALSGVLTQLARIALSAASAPLERQMSNWFGDLLGFGASAALSPASLTGAVPGMTPLGMWQGFHSGGIAGGRATFERPMPAALWDGAPRYHGGGVAGLLPGEVPAVLQRGEGVFTPEQMAALGQTAGGQTTINNVVNVTVNRTGAGGSAAEDKAMATEVARQVQASLRGLVAQELISQSRPGGLLSRTIG